MQVKRISPEIPIAAEWITLGEIMTYHPDHPFPEFLCRRAQTLGLEVHVGRSANQSMIRLSDLHRLINDSVARVIRQGYRPTPALLDEAAHILDIPRHEVPNLAERRGVLVDRAGVHIKIDRRGLVILRDILEAEKAYDLLEDDFIPRRDALSGLRANQNTVTSGGEFGDDDREVVMRCRLLGIRYVQGAGPRSRVDKLLWKKAGLGINGFDLYRLAGCEFETSDLPSYTHIMAQVRASVMSAIPQVEPATATA
jgi:hypothetical protein